MGRPRRFDDALIRRKLNSEDQIESFLDRVDGSIDHYNVERHPRIRLLKRGKNVTQAKIREGGWCLDPDLALELARCMTNTREEIVVFSDDVANG
jgi:hypothetical protein